MDQGPLVETQIKDGARIVEKLREIGFGVIAAWWLKSSEEGLWFLYIAAKDVDEKGITSAYRTMHTVIRDLGPLSVDRFELKLVGPDDPITKDVLAVLARSPGRKPIRYAGRPLGNVSVDDAYIYPPMVAA
jgi:hypothetical protein